MRFKIKSSFYVWRYIFLFLFIVVLFVGISDVKAKGNIMGDVVNNEWPRVVYDLVTEGDLEILEINRKEFEKSGQNEYEYRFFHNDDGKCGVQKFGYNDWGDWDVDHFKILVERVDVIRFKDGERRCSNDDSVEDDDGEVDDDDFLNTYVWTFNEGQGDVTFTDDGELKGVFEEDNSSGGPEWVDGLNDVGSAIYFDGVGDYLMVSDPGDSDFNYSDVLGGTSSLSFWLKTTQSGKNIGWDSPSIIGSEDRGGIRDVQWGWIGADGKINVGVGNTTVVTSKDIINDGEWHHVVISRDSDSGEIVLYIDGGDGVDGGSTTIGSSVSGRLDSISFSAFGRNTDSGGGHRYYEGVLDSINVYDEVVDELVVKDLYEGGGVVDDSDEKKVEVCHIPAGDMSKAKVLSVGISAYDSHIAHGDMDAPCPVGDFDEQLEIGDFSWWNFDEDQGNYSGDIENENTGTIYGAEWVDGVLGSGLNFDGVNDYVEVEKSLVGKYPFVIEGWFKSDGYTDEDQVIVGLANSGNSETQYGVYIENDGSGRLAIRARNEDGDISSVKSNVNVYDGKWHYVVGVFESEASRKLYLDGELVVTDDTEIAFSEVDVMSVGRWSDSTPKSYFNGVIDEVKVSSDVIIDDEVLFKYEEIELPVDLSDEYLPEGGYSSWSFDEGEGNVLGDGENGNEGIVFGATWVDGVVGPGLDFDGSDDYVEIDKSLVGEYPFVIEGWIKSDGYTVEDQVIVGLVNSTDGDIQYGVYLNNDGGGGLAIRASDGETSSVVSASDVVYDNGWHYVVGVFESDLSRKLYLDGGLVATDTTVVPFTQVDMVSIGRWPSGNGDSYFYGMVDEVKVRNQMLLSSEIQENYVAVTLPDDGSGLGLAYLSQNDGRALEGVYPETGQACGKYTSIYRKFNFWKTPTLEEIKSNNQTLARMIYFDCDLGEYVIAETAENLVGLNGNSPTIVNTPGDFDVIITNQTAEDRKLYIDRETNTVKVGTLDGSLIDLVDQGTIMDDLAMQGITNIVAGVHYYNSTDKRFYIGTEAGTLELIFIEN